MYCILCGSEAGTIYRRNDDDCILKCFKCGLLFVSPQPTEEKLRQYYRDFEPDYQFKYKDEAVKRGKKILKIIQGFKKNGRLLDVGCGHGFFMDVARKKGWNVSGVEISPTASEFARSNFSLDVFTGELSEADLKDSYFDLISLQHTLEHLREPLKDLSTVRNKLRDDGLLVVAVPNSLSLMARCAKINWLCLAEKTHLFHYTKSTLAKLLVKSGFRIIIVKTFEWDTQRVLWAIKMLILGQRKSKQATAAARKDAASSSQDDKRGFLKSLIIKMAAPFSWLIAKLGLGAELIVLAKKEM